MLHKKAPTKVFFAGVILSYGLVSHGLLNIFLFVHFVVRILYKGIEGIGTLQGGDAIADGGFDVVFLATRFIVMIHGSFDSVYAGASVLVGIA